MAITPVNSSIIVTSAGTRIQVTDDTDLLVASVYFEGLGTNTGDVFVGLFNVSSSVHIARVAAEQGVDITSDGFFFTSSGPGLQLSDLYVDATVNDQVVQITFMRGEGS